MLVRLPEHANLPVRAPMSGIFILSGVGKIGALEITRRDMEA